MADLAPIDEHVVAVDATPEGVWSAIEELLPRAFSGFGASGLARVLGCREQRAAGPPAAAGSSLPGFRVARSEPPSELALEGRHRFSRYALTFRLDDLGDDRTRLRAETRAEFPGLRGTLYRTLVIGSRGHALVVRRILRAVKRRAERAL